MTAAEMARELRAAGWIKSPYTGWWKDPALGDDDVGFHLRDAHRRMRELAQQRERGTVTTPVVGEEAK